LHSEIKQQFKGKDKGKHEGKGKRKHHARATDDHEHKKKRSREDSSSSSDEEFVFVSTLTGTITQESDVLLIHSGASKHMTGCKTSLSKVKEKKNSSMQVELGDDSKHAVKGIGEASFRLDSGKHVKIKDILLVFGLKKNVLSNSVLEDQGYNVAFVRGKVLAWHERSSIEKATVIGVREGALYK